MTELASTHMSRATRVMYPTTSAPEVTELPSLSTTTSSPALRSTSAARRDEAGEPSPASPLTLVPGGAAGQEDQLAGFRTAPQPAPTLRPAVPTRGRPARRKDRAKHDEKITVYISVLLADLDERGDDSVLVRRLRGN